MYYVSLDSHNRIINLFDIEPSNSDFNWAFVGEHLLTRICRGEAELESGVVEKLNSDPAARLIVSSVIEVIHPDYPQQYEQLFDRLGINPDQVHFIVVSNPQRQMLQQLIPRFKNVSVFNYWEYITPCTVEEWKDFTVDTRVEPKRFLYLNRRLSTDRAFIFYKLWNSEEFKNNCHASMHTGVYWDRSIDAAEHFENTVQQLVRDTGLEKIKKFYKRTELPQLITARTEAYDYDFFGYEHNELYSHYAQTEMSIVADSHPQHHSTGFMPTEKFYRSVAAGQPLLVFGVQHYYKNLFRQGYRFSSIPAWDSEPNLYRRAEQFADHVISLAQRSDWTEYIQREQKYAQHNRAVLARRNSRNSVATDFHPELRAQLKPILPGEI